MADTTTILSNPLVRDMLLPFLLVFALVFAVLEKSEILGKGKRQVDAIVALVIGLIVVSFGNAVHIINYLMPILAVGLVVLLVFMLLWGMSHEKAFEMPKGVKITIGILAAILVISSVVYLTGLWDKIMGAFKGGSSGVVSTVIIIVILVAAIVVVVYPFKSEKKEAGN